MYDEAVFGKPSDEYISSITTDMWGGGLELSILSRYLRTRIIVFDKTIKKWFHFPYEDCFNGFIVLSAHYLKVHHKNQINHGNKYIKYWLLNSFKDSLTQNSKQLCLSVEVFVKYTHILSQKTA